MDYSSLCTYIEPSHLNPGDVLVFGKKHKRQVYAIAYDIKRKSHQLVSLVDFNVCNSWDNVAEMHDELTKQDRNGYQLLEVVSSENLELRRLDE